MESAGIIPGAEAADPVSGNRTRDRRVSRDPGRCMMEAVALVVGTMNRECKAAFEGRAVADGRIGEEENFSEPRVSKQKSET